MANIKTWQNELPEKLYDLMKRRMMEQWPKNLSAKRLDEVQNALDSVKPNFRNGYNDARGMTTDIHEVTRKIRNSAARPALVIIGGVSCRFLSSMMTTLFARR